MNQNKLSIKNYSVGICGGRFRYHYEETVPEKSHKNIAYTEKIQKIPL